MSSMLLYVNSENTFIHWHQFSWFLQNALIHGFLNSWFQTLQATINGKIVQLNLSYVIYQVNNEIEPHKTGGH
jgi:hypothetical protein